MIERLEGFSTTELSNAGWSDESLLSVLSDSSRLTARLHACEILLRRDLNKFLGIIGAQATAHIYASALKAKDTTELNSWAFLGIDELGPMGRHLVACGERAIPVLAPLLDTKQPAGLFGGSEESKVGNSDRARICDFAAYFVSKIRGLPYSFHRDNIAQRDADIEQLKKNL